MWRILGWLSVITSVILVATSLTAYASYRKLQGNIDQEDVSARLGDRPPKLNKAINVLLIGSDSRGGKNSRYGGDSPGERSDTIILMHMSPNGESAVAMSFPRDSVVRIPSCERPNGSTVPAHVGQINESFNEGGAACTWKTIESLTGVHIDHFVKVDFSGFKRVVDALGGVEVCLPSAVNDPKSKLDLPAGRHTVDGEQGLAYVRNRYSMGDGSDLSRIERQQKFLGSVVNEATSSELATNPSKLYGFLDAATQSITTDQDLTVGVMRQIAESGKGMSAGKVRFVTVPTQPHPSDPNRLQWAQPKAQQLFSAIKNDTEVEDDKTKQSSSTESRVPASKVQVQVQNGAGTAGLATRVGDQLRERDFEVLEVGNAPSTAANTAVLHSSGEEQQAQALAERIPGAEPALSDMVPAGTVQLLIGSDWRGLDGNAGGSGARIPESVSGRKANQDICKQ